MGYVDFESDAPAVWSVLRAVEGRRCFDVGANGGMTACMFAEHFVAVVAFEPAAESYERLVEVVPENVMTVPAAVSDHNGTVVLNTASTATDVLGELVTGDSMPGQWGSINGRREVDCVTLETAAIRYGWPDFVKIDTEGHEGLIVAAGADVLRGCRYMVEIHSEENSELVRSLLPGVVVHHPAYRVGGRMQAKHHYLLDPETARLLP